MRLTRVYVEEPLQNGARCRIAGSAANHMLRVLRLGVGTAVTLFDGTGGEYAARIESVLKDSVIIDVGQHAAIERESPVHLALAQGISRGERMDWVIQKATELGVQRIVPLITTRSVVRLDAHQARRKWQHWRGISIAACEQCGRNRIPELASPLELREFLAGEASHATLRLVLAVTASARIRELERRESITLLVGPEGGLAEEEHAAAIGSGFQPVYLGPRVLRTETAAVAALAALQQAFGDL